MSILNQCALLGISRSGYYYEGNPETPENLPIMRRLDELHIKYPVYGCRELGKLLEKEGLVVNRERVMRLLQVMGIEAIYQKPKTSEPAKGHRIYPYLLKDLDISGPDQVWCSDITYIPLQQGFMYLVAVMDWWSRYVLAWEVSNTMDSDFCVRPWERALGTGRRVPDISNTDQGAQFTSEAYIEAVQSTGAQVSMDGRRRWIDNRFIEQLCRRVKYEDVYVRDYLDGLDLGRGLSKWFREYNEQRPHQSLDLECPGDVYGDPQANGARARNR